MANRRLELLQAKMQRIKIAADAVFKSAHQPGLHRADIKKHRARLRALASAHRQASRKAKQLKAGGK